MSAQPRNISAPRPSWSVLDVCGSFEDPVTSLLLRLERRDDDSLGPQSKRATKEKEVDDLAAEIKEIHSKDHNYSDPQYRLWARMIVNGLHYSKDIPPEVPMITGVTPTRPTRRLLEDTVVSTVSAVVKAMASPKMSPVVQQTSSLESQSGVGISPTKAFDIRGKSRHLTLEGNVSLSFPA